MGVTERTRAERLSTELAAAEILGELGSSLPYLVPDEVDGVTVGCTFPRCRSTVRLLFTDPTKNALDARPLHGWRLGEGRVHCPQHHEETT